MFINNKARGKEMKNNILSLSQEAKKAKANDPNVINATIGMLFSETGKLYEFSSVSKVMEQLSCEEKFAYSDTGASPKFSQSIKKYLFSSFLEEIEKENILSVMPTTGGSGALSLLFENYIESGSSVLLPNHMWEVYLVYAKERGINAETYSLFKNGHFDMDSLKLKVDFLKQKQDKIVMLINDPCENPTGFCMEDSDYQELINLAENNPSTNFIYVIDMAYFDFYNADDKVIRSRYSMLKNLPENAMAFFCFSGSKSFGLYGLRIGALVQMTKSQEEAMMFLKSSVFSARARWSSASTLGMSIIEKLVLEDDLYQNFKDEVKNVCLMLERRSKAFIQSAKEVDLEYYPYEKGFFICIPCENPNKLMNELHQDKVYTIATKSAVRIALCAINEQEAKILPKIIKGRMLLID